MTASHAVRRTLPQKLKSLAPFGVGLTKPKHFREMLKVVWKNRDNLGYAWKVVTRGVCDGCEMRCGRSSQTGSSRSQNRSMC